MRKYDYTAFNKSPYIERHNDCGTTVTDEWWVFVFFFNRVGQIETTHVNLNCIRVMTVTDDTEALYGGTQTDS